MSITSVEKSSLASAIHFIMSSISSPAAAIGSKPTGDITENLPPMSSGITKVSYPCSFANCLRAPLLASVVAYILLAASSFPYFFSNISLKILNAIAGSVVVPDLDITFTETSFPSINSIKSAK